ncbi:MAG: hypothetical protein CMJ76_03535 [Planctomycetaceae bacterium]|nr:hypothetical protein [Planctomycetaceae bacterium]
MHLCFKHLNLFVLSALLIQSFLLPYSQAQQPSNDWPRWRGPNGTGRWQAPENLQLDWSANKPVLVWKQSVGASYSGLAVSGNLVITMDRKTNNQTNNDPLAGNERIICLNKQTGELVWEFSYPAHYKDLDYNKGPRITPTIYQKKVYTLGAVGHLTCLDAISGKKIWQRDLVAEEKAKVPTWGYSASPLIINDSQLVIHAALQPNGCFAAFDCSTGKEIWRSGDDPAGYSAPILIQQGENQQLVGWTPKHIIGMSSNNGNIQWKIPYEVTYGVSIATPIYQQGHILVCGYWEGSKLIKVSDDLKTAKLVWEENKYLRGLMSQPLYRENHVYLLDKQHGLVCFNLITGKVVWTDNNQLTPRGRNPQASLVWINNSSNAVCLNAEGELVVTSLTVKGYNEISRHKIIDFTWAHPAYSGDLVFARDDKQLVCYRLPTKVSKPK